MQPNFPFLIAQAISPETSFLDWALTVMVTLSGLFVLFTALLLFVGACYLVATKRSASVLAAYFVLLPIPVVISFCGSLKETIASLVTIAATPSLTLTSAGIAGGLAQCLFGLLMSILLSAPTYAILAYGLLNRTINPPSEPGIASIIA